MRLVNTTTLEIKEFFQDDLPRGGYAILSHRWQEDEVSFQDMQAGTNRDSQGYQKILHCCRIAKMQHLDWAWVDTCCIDKTSSSELSEAINSMYQWYEKAVVCYAFLLDVEKFSSSCLPENVPVQTVVNRDDSLSLGDVAEAHGAMPLRHLQLSATSRDDFSDSSWFTRGWTLQELLAPKDVIFYDARYRSFGSRNQLAPLISRITNIDEQYLCGEMPLRDASIACRMSWASHRVTTRPEDLAYCLLGIFGVNMPLLYGEGSRAFRRLQEEILDRSDDQSLFAWTSEEEGEVRGLLARDPSEFSLCRYVCRKSGDGEGSTPYERTNLGVMLQVPTAPILMWQLLGTKVPARDYPWHGVQVLYPLNCQLRSPDTGESHSIFVLLGAPRIVAVPWVRSNWRASEMGTFHRLAAATIIRRKNSLHEYAKLLHGSIRTIDVGESSTRRPSGTRPTNTSELTAIMHALVLPAVFAGFAITLGAFLQTDIASKIAMVWAFLAIGFHLAPFKTTYCFYVALLALIRIKGYPSIFVQPVLVAMFMLFGGVLLTGCVKILYPCVLGLTGREPQTSHVEP